MKCPETHRKTRKSRRDGCIVPTFFSRPFGLLLLATLTGPLRTRLWHSVLSGRLNRYRDFDSVLPQAFLYHYSHTDSDLTFCLQCLYVFIERHSKEIHDFARSTESIPLIEPDRTA